MGVGGLDDFDEDAAAQNLAAVGQPLPDASVELEGPPRVFDAHGNVMPPDAGGGGFDINIPAAQAQVQKELDANPNAFDAHANVTPVEAEQAAGAPTVSAAAPPAGGAQEVPGQPPAQTPSAAAPAAPEPVRPGPPPVLTGDAAKDTQNNIQYQRQWHDYADQLNARHVEEKTRIAKSQAEQSTVEAKLAREEAAQRAELRKQQAAQREQNQATIAAAVKEKAAAAGDLDGFKWDKPYTGGQIAAIIAGAFAQGLQNMGAIYAGHAPQAQNDAFKLIETRMNQDYQARKDKVARAGDALLQARYGFKDAEDNRRAAQNDLNADYSARWNLVKKEGEERARRAGLPDAEIQNNLIVAGAGQKAAEHEGEILQREEGHQDQRTQAAATLKLAEANLGVRRQAEHDTHMDRVAARGAAAEEKKSKTDAKLDEKTVRDGAGVPRGLAPTARATKQIEDRLVQFDDAIESLKQLKKHVEDNPITGRVPAGDIFNRAGLAVAATTTANASDHTTHMETGTLQNWGIVNPAAVERTLEHVEARREKFMKQLTPLPGATAPKAAAAAPATKKVGGAVYEYVPDDEAP